MANKIKSITDNIKKLQADALKEILNDDSISKLDKFTAIAENELWPVSDWIGGDIFSDWEEECNENERQAAIADGKNPKIDYVCTITDDYFILSDIFENRHETVYYINAIENLLEEDEDEEIIVAKNRGQYHSVVHKTAKEIIDRICDYCFENKVIGCVVDW